MAISATHYNLLREVSKLPHRECPCILEIGQANFYGDMDPRELIADQSRFYKADKSLEEYLDAGNVDSFELVRWIYRGLFRCDDVDSIDADGPDALKYDLNDPIQLQRKYDLVINHGTAEHVFNIANVFLVMHDACAVGGLMIHESPFTGWVDHGFYCLQPTLFWDVAVANGYEIVKVAIEHLASRSIVPIEKREDILEMKRRDQLADNAMLWVAMRKTTAEAFKVPMQGNYAGTISNEAMQAWRELR